MADDQRGTGVRAMNRSAGVAPAGGRVCGPKARPSPRATPGEERIDVGVGVADDAGGDLDGDAGRAANLARRQRTEDKLRRVADAISHLQRRRLPVTYPAIAARAGVSRTFPYDNPAARDLVTAAVTGTDGQRRHDAAARDAQAEASWQQRALNVEQALKAAHAETRTQRARIGELLGQLRDARDDHDPGAAERLAAENRSLRQRVRDLAAANRALDERLQAARSNNRFLDKRIAGLEAQLLNEGPAT
jgi:hypothetical protein